MCRGYVFSVFTVLPVVSSSFCKEQSDLTCPPAFVLGVFQKLELALPCFSTDRG